MKFNKIRLYIVKYSKVLYKYVRSKVYTVVNLGMLVLTLWLFTQSHNYSAWIIISVMLLIVAWRLYKGWGLYKSTVEYGARAIIAVQDQYRNNKLLKKKARGKKKK